MAPSVTVPKTMARPIQSVATVGRTKPRRCFSSPGAAVSCGPSASSPGRAARTRTASRTAARPKCTARVPVNALTPEASRAASSDPALKVACSRDMVVRSKRASSAAPWAFIATLRQPTATPSQNSTSSVTG